jgi:uncharacterized protein
LMEDSMWLSSAALLTVLPLIAQAPEAHPEELVKRPPAKEGLAPKMKVTELSRSGRSFELTFSRGDDVASGLHDFALAQHLSVAHFTAIGAFDHAVLGWSDPKAHSFKRTVLDQEVEVVACSGSITVTNGKANVHAHAVVALPDGSTRGGDLLEGRVSLTLQVFLEDAEPLGAASAQK